MCMLCELLHLIGLRFGNLKSKSSSMTKNLSSIINLYTEAIDEEKYLYTLMTEKDYLGRDSLKIINDLELFDVLTLPSIENVVNQIYTSHYKQTGNILEMSTTYQMLFGSQFETYGFYKKRYISQAP